MSYKLDFNKIIQNIDLFGPRGIIIAQRKSKKCCCLFTIDYEITPFDVTIDESIANHFVQIMFFLSEYYCDCATYKSFTKQQLTELIDDNITQIVESDQQFSKKQGENNIFTNNMYSEEFVSGFPKKIEQFLFLFCNSI